MTKHATPQDIDIVVTYLDSSDQEWLKERDHWRRMSTDIPEDENTEVRYRNMNNFHFLLRSIEAYAPWVHKVHIVTWGHLPEWLDTDHPKLNIVTHQAFIPKECLPTFNSNAIEIQFDRIPGLAEYFINMNDDMFLNAPTQASDFFRDGKPRLDITYHPFTPPWFVKANNITALNSIVDNPRPITKKLFSPKNGWRSVLKNIYFLPLVKSSGKFIGFHAAHLTVPTTKTIYKEVKSRLPEHVAYVACSKFRDSRDNRAINQWIMQDYARATNQFVPHNSAKFGKHLLFDEKTDFDRLFRSSYKVLSLSDDDRLSQDEFERAITQMNNAFAKKFPHKSSFEK